MAERFLSRWARLKRERDAGEGEAPPGEPADPRPAAQAPAIDGQAGDPAASPAGDEPQAAAAGAGAAGAEATGGDPARAGTAGTAGTATGGAEARPRELPPLASLTPESDFTPFLQRGVAPATRNAALKKLFADPAFNVMDGLDVYIEDFNKTTPIPEGLLRRLAQSRAVGLFDELGDEPQAEGSRRAAAPAEIGAPAGAAAPADAPDVAAPADAASPIGPAAATAPDPRASPGAPGSGEARAGAEVREADARGGGSGDAAPGCGADTSRGKPVPE